MGATEVGGQLIARFTAAIEIEVFYVTIAPTPARTVAEGIGVIVHVALGGGVGVSVMVGTGVEVDTVEPGGFVGLNWPSEVASPAGIAGWSESCRETLAIIPQPPVETARRARTNHNRRISISQRSNLVSPQSRMPSLTVCVTRRRVQRARLLRRYHIAGTEPIRTSAIGGRGHAVLGTFGSR